MSRNKVSPRASLRAEIFAQTAHYEKMGKQIVENKLYFWVLYLRNMYDRIRQFENLYKTRKHNL